jgi:hypothetical protein
LGQRFRGVKRFHVPLDRGFPALATNGSSMEKTGHNSLGLTIVGPTGCNYSSPYGGMRGSCMATMFIEVRRNGVVGRRPHMLG